MPVFICTKCGHLENTALSHYWQGSRLCSLCDPVTGKWHGVFPRTLPTEEEKEIAALSTLYDGSGFTHHIVSTNRQKARARGHNKAKKKLKGRKH